MAPFEAMYGHRCHTTLNWSGTGDSQIYGLDHLREAKEQVHLIRDRLKASRATLIVLRLEIMHIFVSPT
jgi:hypothetical protein